MALHFFRRLDARLANDLKSQRKPITLGLVCVLFSSLLTTATIGIINQSVQAVQDAAPDWARGGKVSASVTEAQRESKLIRLMADRLDKPEAEVKKAYDAARNQRVNTQKDALRKLQWLCLLVVGIFGTKYFFTRGQNLFLTKAVNNLAADLRMRMFAKVQKLPMAYFNETRSGEIQSVLTNDVHVYQSAVMIIRDSLDGPVRAITAFGYITFTQPLLSLLVVCTFPIMWLFIQSNGKRMRKAQEKVQEHLAELNAVTTEAILGTRVIKAFGAEEVMAKTYRASIATTLNSQLKAARRFATLRPMVEFIGAVSLAVILLVCGQFAYQGNLQVAELAALMFALDVINQGFRALGNVNNTYNQVQAAADRIYGNLLELPEEHSESKGTLRPEHPKGEIEFRNVGFIYPDGTRALSNVSFTLKQGESLALVGPSGAGKSTIADLMLRFYDPTEGVVLFDGTDIRQLDQQWLRAQIGVVPQSNFLFAGTIEENLRLGNPEASKEQVARAAGMAHCLDFIDRLPDGIETRIGERGVGLSGGEQQRLSIGRALVRDPVVLLMDEATSALDAHSERAVQEALDEVMSTRTTLFIAHRLTTASRASRILVLRRGEVAEIGSHRELMSRGGVYAQMVEAFGEGMMGETIG